MLLILSTSVKWRKSEKLCYLWQFQGRTTSFPVSLVHGSGLSHSSLVRIFSSNERINDEKSLILTGAPVLINILLIASMAKSFLGQEMTLYLSGQSEMYRLCLFASVKSFCFCLLHCPQYHRIQCSLEMHFSCKANMNANILLCLWNSWLEINQDLRGFP